MMMTCGSPFFPFTYMNPSAPAPPDLLITMKGFGDSLYLSMIGLMNRAMTSAPPPVPAGMMNSTGFVGSQAFAVPMDRKMNAKEHTRTTQTLNLEVPFLMVLPSPCQGIRFFVHRLRESIPV